MVMVSTAVYTGICMVFVLPNDIVMLENTDFNTNKLTPQLFSVELNLTASNENVTASDTRGLAEGKYPGEIRFLGFIPVKDVDINVIKSQKVIPCGNSIGVKLYTDGLVVVDIAEFKDISGNTVSPCKNKNIKPGDRIIKVNGIKPQKISVFTDAVVSSNGNVSLEIDRDGRIIHENVTAVYSAKDDALKLGIMVRDSTAGIGTLTFYNPYTKTFGALGHGISDPDTQKILPVASGELVPSTIISVEKGVAGRPGELRGSFVGNKKLGTVFKNCNCGLYGVLETDGFIASSQSVEIADKSEVKTGKAHILTNISGEKVEKFNIEITKISHQTSSDTKGMVIKITDETLLSKTGGIVQGMSGSPIIQNDKLIGAVTHVFVNDPTRGYGIFIENMLSEAEKIK